MLEPVTRGCGDREIAAELVISVKTVSVHVSNVPAEQPSSQAQCGESQCRRCQGTGRRSRMNLREGAENMVNWG
ncbi:LuxR C-terminal-related transcriptional regulator [Nocardiopsis mangrovi]|uniref:LuxR C-terminal-related transcriptional regulator n=1 Tax=Nocardiopsis mangrovi TaxID=1179818 RepID=A0ABV9DTA7_9ACTN